MKYAILIILFLAMTAGISAQDKYISKNGHIWFYSSTPIETIEAHNNQAASVIDIKKGEIAFDLLIRAFKFEKALMEEHFNENYMESEKYPKSKFAGKFIGFNSENFRKNGAYDAAVEGNLTIHGITKQIKIAGKIEVKDGKINVKAKFDIKPEDYKIAIPGLVRDKIASIIQTTVDVQYEPKK
ncbi:MAG: hypothetical protein QG635_2330 [Bacteroidota bacterium]|nr:hypothetical protein [Bacteroidota bacterium]